MDARAHEYVGLGLIEIMPPATLHCVGIIAKLYFVFLAAFEGSVTLNLAQWSFMSYNLVTIESSYTISCRPLI